MNAIAPSSSSPGIAGDRLLLDITDHLDDIKLGLVTLARVTANAKSEDGNDAWWIGTKVLDEVKALSDLVESARASQTKPDPLISTQDDDGCAWIKATEAEAEMFCTLRLMSEAERLAIIADVTARPVPEEAEA